MTKKRFALKDLTAFFGYFRKESDRACAVLARALLEDSVGNLFQAHFVSGTQIRDILEGQSGLATFSARIRVAAALGWLSRDEASDLHRIREIGNDFAHGLSHEMTFEEESIRARVLSLESPRVLVHYGDLGKPSVSASDLNDMEARARRRFEIAVAILDYSLRQRAEAVVGPQPVKSLLMLLDEAARPT